MATSTIKKKWKTYVGIIVALVVVGLGGWYILRGKGTTQAQAASVVARRETIEVKVSANGTVEPSSSRNVTPKIGGTITRINFKSGQRVKKGDLLVQLDSSNIQAQIDKARLDQRQAQLDLGSTGQQLRQQQVYAPISGRVTGLQVSKGQDVQKGSALMTVQDTTTLTFQVPFNDVSNIKVGQKADVAVTDLLSGSQLSGYVKKVNRAGIANSDGTMMYYITVAVSNPGALAPGMNAQAAVHTSKGVIDGYDVGQLQWGDSYVVRAGVSGIVNQLPVEENYSVRKGQMLAYLTSDTLDTQIDSQSLKLQQSQLSITDLEKQLADYNIYATADGVINTTQSTDTSSSSSKSSTSNTSTDLQVGDEVKAGQVLATIDNVKGMVVTVPVDEVDIAKVKVGQKANITFDALPDKNYTGSVCEVGNQGTVQNSVATFDVKISVDRSDGLKAGMTANVEILVSRKENALVVPIEAVQERQGRKIVFLDTGETRTGRSTGSNGGSGGRSRSSDSGSNSGSGGWSRSGDSGSSGGSGSWGGSRGSNGSGSGSGSGSSGGWSGSGGNTRLGKVQPVETGLYNETLIEITSGLNEGDRVILPSVARSTSSGSGGGGMRMPFGGGGGSNRSGSSGGNRGGF